MEERTVPNLNEVFGVRSTVPQYTYVNRSHLDERLIYYLKLDRHIVIYGASRQGKSSLRKKCLPEENCVVLRCHGSSTVQNIYEEILRQLSTQIPVQTSHELTYGGEIAGSATAKVQMPFFGGGA